MPDAHPLADVSSGRTGIAHPQQHAAFDDRPGAIIIPE
jgi:hypothetical protein